MRLAWFAVVALFAGMAVGQATGAGGESVNQEEGTSQDMTEPMLLFHSSTDAYDTPESRAALDELLGRLEEIQDPNASYDISVLKRASEIILDHADVEGFVSTVRDSALRFMCPWRSSDSGRIPPAPVSTERSIPDMAFGVAKTYRTYQTPAGWYWEATYAGFRLVPEGRCMERGLDA